jgi:hypothetical protein
MNIVAYVDSENCTVLCDGCFGIEAEVDYTEFVPVYDIEEDSSSLVCDNCLCAVVEHYEEQHSPECVYCFREARLYTISEIAEIGWESIAEEHATDCEWVITRAFSREIMSLEKVFENGEHVATWIVSKEKEEV